MSSAPRMITAAAIIGLAGWFLTTGVSSPSPDLAPATAPAASLEASAEPSAAAIVFDTPAIHLEADSIRFEGDAVNLEVPAQALLLEGVEADTRTLTAAWVDGGVERQLLLGLGSDETDWWITGVVASDDTTASRIMDGHLREATRTPLGEMLVADLRLRPTGARTPVLIIDGLRLSAFMPGTDPAPLTETGCHLLTDGDEVSMADLPDDIVEAHDRLVALGICHDFVYTYPVSDPASVDLVATERWCTPPPAQAARAYTRAERKPRTDPFGVHAGPYEAQRDGRVHIHVEDLVARPYRTQPPTGWDCPVR